MEQHIIEAVDAYIAKQFEYDQFLVAVLTFFQKHPLLNKKPFPVIHSIKSRFKDPVHLADKIERKVKTGRIVNKENIFSEITDLIGVRVLHLHQDQFKFIDAAINEKVQSGDWLFVEPPKAYTWDPESAQFYNSLNIRTEVKETFYTSIHYTVKPNNYNQICCEIQVRTLFEEIWGEIDHTINYPLPTDSLGCREQIKVLARLVSTGTRLADSIFRTAQEHTSKQSTL